MSDSPANGRPAGGASPDGPPPDEVDPTGAVAGWWATAVSRMEPGVIELRGRPVQDLIGRVGLTSMIWLMLRGDLPTARQAELLEAALVAAVDHGPQAPSIAVARMAATCGIGLNGAVASAVNTLGDSHGGAGEQCVVLLDEILREEAAGTALETAAARAVARGPRYVPGFGHRFHPVDPRRDPLLSLVERAAADGVVPGDHLRAGRAVEDLLAAGRSRPVPMNIDGATAIIYAELGFPAPLARGLFVLSRSVGILAHAWEESGQGRRNKGPIPRSVLPAHLA
ncbi:citryl-CoA lyase [Actinomadura viridis]|uniref:citrate synthase (unknown stereospecificity) n=1 Tax=Actinomadura viridis TaxID=58110 RepID=A0A931DQG5_9ACTN|nr:citryl-CoA lyase [Actinomadura viridis]MBG6091500.1 citrate synthase [Actinomadura viridis]